MLEIFIKKGGNRNIFDINFIKSIEDYQRSNFYRAKVVSLDDPLKLNRIQIMIYGLTEDIPTDCQPWSEFQFRDGVITYPNVDDIIWIFFENGDIFRPVYLGTIYAGMNASCDEGWKQFLAKRPTAIANPDEYKVVINRINNITDPDARLVIKDVHQQFNNFMLSEDNIQKVFFSGKNDVTQETVPNNPPFPPRPPKSSPVMTCHPSWAGTFPDTFTIDPEPMYLWYKTEETANALGGWTFYTEEELKTGLAMFPDNLANINYKRYQTWKGLVDDSYFIIEDLPASLKKRPIDWNFIPLPPWHYWHPEMMIGGTAQFHQLMSFPFGKMNLKNRKNYKQHTILSHDGKSAIELDDNDDFERLRLDFNYGSGGLEFSNAGFRGAELWTDGALHLNVEGKDIGGGRTDSRFVFNRHTWRVFGGKEIVFSSKGPQTYFSTNDITLIGKYGNVDIVAGSGISLTAKGAQGTASATNTGEPVVAAKDGCKSSLFGNFLFLDAAGPIPDGEAAVWMSKFNAALGIILKLCQAIQADTGSLCMIGAANMIGTAAAAVAALQDWKIASQPSSIVRLAGAWEGIQFQIGEG